MTHHDKHSTHKLLLCSLQQAVPKQEKVMEIRRSWKGLGKSVKFFTYHSSVKEFTEMPDTAEYENM